MFIVSPTAVALTLFAFLPLDSSGSGSTAAAARSDSLIVDRAGFFSPEAEQEAIREIERLKREKQVEVRVVTFPSVPDGQAAKVEGMSSRERGEFFSNWLKEIAREKQAKGVLILICKEPSHLRVGISKELYRRGFGDQQRGAISERLLRSFRSQNYDRGLLDAIAYIQTTAERGGSAAGAGAGATGGGQVARRQAPRTQQSMGSSIGGMLCVGLVLFLGVMVVMSLVRMFRRPQVPQGYGGYGHPGQGPQGYGQQYPGQYGGGYGAPGGGWGGGGMFGGLMSGLGGALLGNYLYDRWNSPSGGAGQTPMDPGAGAGMYDDSRYQDFTSSGGDFGDAGGGDFGGGGDWGGGDGGGDF